MGSSTADMLRKLARRPSNVSCQFEEKFDMTCSYEESMLSVEGELFALRYCPEHADGHQRHL
jgi:hypothetical protein